MDKILIKNFSIKTMIGINDWERCIEQKLLINLSVNTDVKKAAETDDIQHALDYVGIVNAINTWVEQNKGFNLIETFAEMLAAMLLENFPIQCLSLSVAKPFVLENVAEIAVYIERP